LSGKTLQTSYIDGAPEGVGRPNEGSFKRELGWALRLGGPLAIGELGWMSTYIVDAVMIGRLPHSALSIAASSLGNTIYYALAFFAIYLLNGLETFVAQAFGRGDREECIHMLAQSMWIVLAGTPMVMLLTLGSLTLLPHFGTPPEIVAETHRYINSLIWSTAPLMLYMALRRYLQSVDRVAAVSVSLVTAAVVNLAADWVFLYGHFGVPAMGVAGSGWATFLVRVWMLAVLLAATSRNLRSWGLQVCRRMLKPDWSRLRGLLRIGWPSGLEYSLELGISTYMSILCARLGTIALAAHQVTLDLNAFVYMVPAGLSYAAMIRVGQGAGRNDLRQVRQSASATFTLAMSFSIIASLLFVSLAPLWAGLYTNDRQVVATAVPIFAIAGILQLGDTAFVIFASALTGLGNTRTPLIISVVCNWILGMPIAWLLAFRVGQGLHGLWIGRAVGSLTAGAAIYFYWLFKMRQAQQMEADKPISLLTPLQVQ
jgi:MATE family multidrug resistance protein